MKPLQGYVHPAIITITVPGNKTFHMAFPLGTEKPLPDDDWDELIAQIFEYCVNVWPTEAAAEERDA